MSTKKKRTKKRTLSEFKAWLEGIEDMQEDDWFPNLDQWQTIRSAIHGIIEEEFEYIEQTNIPIQRQLPERVTANTRPQIQQSALENVEDVPVITSPNIQNNTIPNQNPGTNNAPLPQPRHLKQDIDTSDGNYVSEFS